MPAPLLHTKFYLPPSRPEVVPRTRLVERLNQGLRRKLALISAPAGFGKTTLVSEWAAGCDHPVAWLSLDERDADAAVFLTYFIAALQMVAEHIGGGALAALQSPPPLPIETILVAFLNEIAALPGDFFLILDDYHTLDSQAVDDALAFLIEHLPPNMHLVIATREDPHLPLARLRARGQLTELRAADLRFTPAEAADFLNRVMGLNLSVEEVAALETRTEGWIAGLQLAALSMQGHHDTASFIRSFTASHRFVLDYLVEEVLQQQPRNIQAFLLRTSILDRLCGPLCDAMLLDSSAPGQKTLEYLERANLFLVSLDDERRWYRYHHLFGELLRQRLGNSQELAQYHLRASEWFEVNDDLSGAFNHALAAGDFERAARLAEAAWQGMERSFQNAAWLGWVNKLPEAVVRSRPWLCVQVGWALSDGGDLEASEVHLQNAERALAGTNHQEEFRAIPGTIALIRASNAQNRGDLIETVKYAELSIQLTPEEDIFLRAQAAITLGFTHWSAGDLESSLRAMYTWIEEMGRLGNQVFVIASAFAVADMQVIMGRLGEAEKALRGAIQRAAAHGPEAVAITAHHHLGLALLAHERGDAAATAQYLQTAAELGQRTTLVDWPYRWNLAQARLKESVGEWDAALDLLDLAGRVYVKNPIPLLQPVEAHKARVYLKQGRLDKAAEWAQERRLSVADEVGYLGEYEYLTLARLQLGVGVFTGVDELLDRLLLLAEAQKRAGNVIEILLAQALVQQAQGDHVQAFSKLERALALAEPEGYRRIFVDEGEALRELLVNFRSTMEKHATHPLSGYVNRILAAFSQPAGLPVQPTPSSQASEIIEALTDRELEILQLIAAGRSNAEIGQRLYLALSTVKGHNLRIFDKLQVENRTEAVARARELGLL